MTAIGNSDIRKHDVYEVSVGHICLDSTSIFSNGQIPRIFLNPDQTVSVFTPTA
jgi:hypothetical protein